MSNAAIDVNSKQTVTARLKTDGSTVKRLLADGLGALQVTLNTSNAVSPKERAATDDNGRTSLFAVSEDSATQLVALQCDSNGNLLIKEI